MIGSLWSTLAVTDGNGIILFVDWDLVRQCTRLASSERSQRQPDHEHTNLDHLAREN